MGLGIATRFVTFILEYQIPIRVITLVLLQFFVSVNKPINSNNAQCNLIKDKGKTHVKNQIFKKGY